MKDEILVFRGRVHHLHVCVLSQPLSHLFLHQQDLRVRAVGESLLHELAGRVQVGQAGLQLITLFACKMENTSQIFRPILFEATLNIYFEIKCRSFMQKKHSKIVVNVKTERRLVQMSYMRLGVGANTVKNGF